jgi:hypothetical protein
MGCGTKVAYFYFMILQVTFSLILFNLFIASIINAYQTVHKMHTSAVDRF